MQVFTILLLKTNFLMVSFFPVTQIHPVKIIYTYTSTQNKQKILPVISTSQANTELSLCDIVYAHLNQN